MISISHLLWYSGGICVEKEAHATLKHYKTLQIYAM